MFGGFAVLLGFLIATHVSYAQDREKLLGAWKLVSFEMEYQASGKRKFVYGEEPKGYIIFTSEGRMMTVITGEGRKPAKPACRLAPRPGLEPGTCGLTVRREHS
jgi:Lipocalin-like domain